MNIPRKVFILVRSKVNMSVVATTVPALSQIAKANNSSSK